MVRIRDVDVDGLTSVMLNGRESVHMIDQDMTTLFAYLPDGVLLDDVNDIRLKRTVADGSTYVERVDIGSSKIQLNAGDATSRVSVEGGILQINGKDLGKAVRVRVNGKEQKFAIVSETTVVSTLPERDLSIRSVEVINTSKTINRRSFFEYLIGSPHRKVEGVAKLVQQFVKLLLTTPGTDVFNPDIGGGLQRFPGKRVNMDNPQSLVTQTVLSVVSTASKITAQQLRSNLPPEETLSDVQVLDVGVDPSDPSIMELSLKLNTFAGRQAMISLLLGEVLSAAESASLSPVTS